MYRAFTLAAICLALIVIVAGAYVRLSDAGLGCPDWPGCYGKPTPSHAAEEIARAVIEQGGEHGSVSFSKAWKEMGHRYLAGILCILIAMLFVLSWRPAGGRGYRRAIASGTLLAVLFQAALGMWTVTLLLKPAIVTAHLLGGLTVLSLLIWLYLSECAWRPAHESTSLRLPAFIGLLAVSLQVMLGGWVSANYAALACPDFPLCRGAVVPAMAFADSFHVFRELGQTAAGELLSLESLTAIHWIHRSFALVVLLLLTWVILRALSSPLRRIAFWVAVLLIVQVSLGITIVLLGLPLPAAAAHNLGASLLLGSLVMLNFFAFSGLAPVSASRSARVITPASGSS